jgi:hypothetical protein
LLLLLADAVGVVVRWRVDLKSAGEELEESLSMTVVELIFAAAAAAVTSASRVSTLPLLSLSDDNDD